MNCPQVRFVERAGTTVIEDLGRNNPLVSEWSFPRPNCLPCPGCTILAAEAEEEATRMVRKEGSANKLKKEGRVFLPSCTSE